MISHAHTSVVTGPEPAGSGRRRASGRRSWSRHAETSTRGRCCHDRDSLCRCGVGCGCGRRRACRLHRGRPPASPRLLRAFRAGELQRGQDTRLGRVRHPSRLRGRPPERAGSHRRREPVVLAAGYRDLGRDLAAAGRSPLRHRGRRHHDPQVAHSRCRRGLRRSSPDAGS